MKYSTLLGLILFLSIPCFAQKQSYTINGTIHNIDLNGEIAELSELEGGVLIQNSNIYNNTFGFKGTTKKPELWLIAIENHRIPFVVENADIFIEIYPDSTVISGTAANDNFQTFIRKSNAYRKQITELFTRYQNATEDSPEKDFLQKQFEDMEKDWQSRVVVKFIEDNINNPAGQNAFKSISSELSIDELKDIIANVDSINIRNPYLQKTIEYINSLEKVP
jgi:hypothetical protein